MKYLRTFESNNKVLASIAVSYFPKGDKKDMKGTWTTFLNVRVSGAFNRKCQQDWYNLIWQKYFGKDDPCKGKQLGPCRPEFDEYPKELIDVLTFFKDESYVVEFEKHKKKEYWREDFDHEWEYEYPLPELDEISEMRLEFNSEEHFYDWLDNFRFLLFNGYNDYEEYITSKKYNL